MEDLVSIVIPIYKVEKYIANCIQSVLKQTYQSIEIILVDDGTPDQSIAIAEDTLKASKVNYRVIHQENAGLGAARNTGLKASKGTWVYFLDSDDAIIETTIESMVKATVTKPVDFVFCSFNMTSNIETNQSYPFASASYLDKKALLKGFLERTLVILAPGTLYRKAWLNENNLFFEKIPWSEDQHFIWRALSVSNQAAYIPTPFYQYYVRPNSIMTGTNIPKIIVSYAKIKELPSYFEDETVKKYLVPRWVMGTLNWASTLAKYKDWKKLMVAIDGKANFKTLLNFPNRKVKLTARLGILLPHLYYSLIQANKKGKMRQ